uniref:Scaffolding protein n=1 Tax=viral metagenome TaxID=1070528 RepID=A0A6M3JT46_9ZZZZ
MANEGQEQTLNPTEQDGDEVSKSELNPFASKGTGDASEGKEATPDGKEVEGAETEDKKSIPLTETPEYKEEVKRLDAEYQSRKDKELRPIYTEKSKLESEVTRLKADAESKEQDYRTKIYMAAEQTNWKELGIEEPQLREFETAQKQVYAEYQRQQKMMPKVLETERTEAAITAFKNVLGEDNLGKVTIADLNAVKELFADVSDSGAIKAISRLAEREVKAKYASTLEKPPEKPAEKKPPARVDSGVHSVPGGIDYDKLSPREKIQYGLDHPSK